MSYIEHGYWNDKKKKIKLKYPFITEEDLSYCEGKEKVMMEILSYKLGKTEQELLYIIVSL
jgi:5'(3')-deoxyribonucleotidase